MKLNYNDINKIIRIIIWIVLPFIFIKNPYIFMFLLLIQVILIGKSAKNFDIGCINIYLFIFLFNSISIFSIRLYDWVSLSIFIIILFRNKKLQIKNEISMFILLSILTLNFVIFRGDDAFQELLRYFLSILIFINITNISFSWKKMKPYLLELSLVNLYNCLMIFIFTSKNMINNISNTIISSDIFLSKTELRMNGFFSDPNKYMVFCTFLIFVVYYFYKQQNNYFLKIILYISGLLSFSRTIFIVYMILISFLIYTRILRRIDMKGKVIIAILCISLFYIFLKLDIVSHLYQFITVLSGRERTMEISATVSEDSRYFIWMKSFNFIKSNIFLGHGLLSFENLLPYPTHNTFIELVLDGGIILLGSWVLFFRKIFYKKTIYLLFPLIIVPVFLLDLANYRILFILLALLYIERMNTDENSGVHEILW